LLIEATGTLISYHITSHIFIDYIPD
jgi:hypothetical protein